MAYIDNDCVSGEQKRQSAGKLARAVVVEPLEARCLLSAINLSGTAGNDVASIAVSGGSLVFVLNGQTQTFTVDAATSVNVDLGGGDDNLKIAVGTPGVSVRGAGGNDTIVARNNNDTIGGGNGDDLIVATGAGDLLRGGAGNDLFLTAGGGGESVDGGSGLNFAQRNPSDTQNNIFQDFDPTRLAAASSAAPIDAAQVPGATESVVNGIVTITGSGDDDTISVLATPTRLKITANATALAPVPLAGISGLQITGGAGDDSIAVDSSVTLPATLNGGNGNDTLVGGGGGNVLVGGIGSDSLLGGAGKSLLIPGREDVSESAPSGNDTLSAGSGSAIADFSRRTDNLTLSNDGRADSGDVAAGEASMIMSNVLAIFGGIGNDTITGTQPAEFLSGGRGADSIAGGGANDLIVGGAGIDTVSVAAEPVILDLRDNLPDQYFGVSAPAEDTLILDQGLDSVTPVLTDPIVPGNVTVTLTKAATVDIAADGTPQDIAAAPGDTKRLFIDTRDGNILILRDGNLKATPFLDMAAAGINIYTGGEGGLLDLAFSPDYSTPGTAGFGKFYTVDTEPFSVSTPADYGSPEDYPTTTVLPNNQIVLREWTVSAGNANVANTTSRVLLRINHPESNHQGGSLRFGPDGDLYMGLGDGGDANDQGSGPDDPTDGHTNDIGNAQDLTVPFGKILRINPNPNAAGATISANGQYSIPDDNPFASGAGGALKEIYAYGLRNPYRITFDSATGKLYVNDVGQNNREEVDIITAGGDYGWPFVEGTRDNSGDFGHAPPPGFNSIAPIGQYTHADGDATIGSAIYHGSDVPALAGDVLFGDLNGTTGNGRLFYMSGAGGTIHEFSYAADSAPITGALYGVTTDAAGEPYYFFGDGSILTFAPA